MKNLYILPTENSSRLVKIYNDVNRETFTLKLDVEVNDSFKEYVNVYITSDEEIKDGERHLHYYEGKHVISKSYNSAVKVINEIAEQFGYKKIILTTDADLINEGVQEITDEFLEWFVKNPSCEWVEVGYGVIRLTENDNKGYWISIPNAEFNMSIEEPKQETLEKAAEKYSEKTASIKILVNDMQDRLVLCESAFEAGAKWQQEQNKNLYSEEDVRKMFSRYNEIISHRDVEEWQPWIDKQFKKK